MINIRTLCFVIFFSISLAPAASSEKHIDPRLNIFYSHLVGSWTGKNDDHGKRPMESLPLNVNVRAEPRKNRLRFDYFYGVKGTKSESHQVRTLRVDVDKSTLVFAWSDDDEAYQITDLGQLLATGYGDFQITRLQPANGINVLYRATFHLSENHLDYYSEKSQDGQTFSQMAHVSLQRTTSSPAPPTQQPEGLN